jgi:hypothetical protein
MVWGALMVAMMTVVMVAVVFIGGKGGGGGMAVMMVLSVEVVGAAAVGRWQGLGSGSRCEAVAVGLM